MKVKNVKSLNSNSDLDDSKNSPDKTLEKIVDETYDGINSDASNFLDIELP